MRLRKMLSFMLLITAFTGLFACSGFGFDETNTDVERYEIETGMTYEEKVEQLLGQFDDYQTDIDGDVLAFCGSVQTSYSASKIEYLSATDDDITKDYSASFDTETGIVTLTISYIDDENVIKADSYETVPYYVEEDNDYYIDFNNEVFSIGNMLMSGKINECIAIVDDVAVLGTCAVLLAGAYLLTVIANDPTYQMAVNDVITQVTEAVTTVVKSIISWFKSIVQTVVRYVTKTVVTTIKTVKTIYNVTVASVDFTLEEATAEKYKDNGKYYLALADTVDGNVYMSNLEINKDFASAVLSTGALVPLATKSSIRVYLSTYTFRQTDARDIAVQASSRLGMGGLVIQHPAHTTSGKIGMYFAHFHPCYPYQHSAHSFFGTPVFI